MIAKGGASPLQQEAIDAIIHVLLPLAMVVTPNIPEAEVLSGMRITDEVSRLQVAKRIHEFGCKHVMIKGGHDKANIERATDLLYDGETFTEFTSRRLTTRHTHGTGCTFAAAITSGLAQGLSMQESFQLAKRFIQAAIAEPLNIGSGHGPTNHLAYQRRLRETANDLTGEETQLRGQASSEGEDKKSDFHVEIRGVQ
jgi:hydroxymethylpyrimidine/phosphomethylpyrimidine kinase